MTVEVDGVALETETLPGDGAGGPPLVFLHEGPGCVEMWRRFPAAARPVTYLHHEADVVLPALLAATGIERPMLIGHSDGASIALLHAGAGDDVAGLVLLAPHVVVEDVTVASIAAPVMRTRPPDAPVLVIQGAAP